MVKVPKLKIRSSSIIWLYLLAVVPLVLAALSQFDLIDLSAQTGSILSIIVGLFIAAEVGLRVSLKGVKMSKKPINIIGGIVAAVVIIGATLDLLAVPIMILQTIQGFVSFLAVIYLLIVAFTE